MNILHKSFERKYNIISWPVHERQDSYMARTGHNFWLLQHAQAKHWEEKFAPVPDNVNILDKTEDLISALPRHVDYDFIIAGSRFGHFQMAKQIQKYLNIPILLVEHTLPMKGYWPEEQIVELNNMRGEHNVFITSYSMNDWGWQNKDDTTVVRHCVDTDLFQDLNLKRERTILTVANDYIGRDFFLNYSQYKRVTEGLPTRPVGDTPGLSFPSRDITDLIHHYNTCQVFLNTAHISPIPTVIMEAMSCACPVISCNTCAIPEFITHGKNGLLYNSDEECRQYLEFLLNDETEARRLGEAGRQNMIENFTVQKFVDCWNSVYDRVADMCYRG